MRQCSRIRTSGQFHRNTGGVSNLPVALKRAQLFRIGSDTTKHDERHSLGRVTQPHRFQYAPPAQAPSRHTGRAICLLFIALALSGGSTRTLVGPPFQTDDPEPVDLGHYEFYVFAARDGTPLETDPVGPAFEFNWGALPNTQLHAVLSFGAIEPSNNPHYAPAGAGPSAYGLLDTELGVKYRFIQQTDSVPEWVSFRWSRCPLGECRARPGCRQDLVQAAVVDPKGLGPVDHLWRWRLRNRHSDQLTVSSATPIGYAAADRHWALGSMGLV